MATPTKRKAKILCLHGYLQNAETFRAKTGALRKGLKSKAEFVFVEAPYDAQIASADLLKAAGGVQKEQDEEGEGEEEGKPQQQQGKSWWNWTDTTEDGSLQPRPSKALHYKGVEATLELLKAELEKHQPDGILGFSQGATATVLLLAALQQEFQAQGTGDEDAVALPKFAIVVSGFYPRDEVVAESIKAARPTVPALFVAGETDALVAMDRTRELMDCCEDGVTSMLVHGGGHFVPTWKGEFKETVSAFIDKHFFAG